MSDNDKLLGRIDGKLDSLIASFGAHRERHDKLEARVRSVEVKQHWYAGAAAAVAALIGYIIPKTH